MIRHYDIWQTAANVPSRGIVQSVLHGKPFTHTTYNAPEILLSRPSTHRRVDLKGAYLAYITSAGGDAVVIRNLVTGVTSTMYGEAREMILSLIHI